MVFIENCPVDPHTAPLQRILIYLVYTKTNVGRAVKTIFSTS